MTASYKTANGPRGTVGDIAALFVGRLGGLALTFVFLPLYDAAMGPEIFGAVALVLSTQAFFLVFDFGFAPLLGNEAAKAGDDPIALASVAADWRLAERLLLAAGLFAGLMLGLLWVLWPAGRNVAGPYGLPLVALLVAILMLANASQAVLNARGRYRFSSVVALGGTLGRGLAALAAFSLFRPSFTIFVASQLLAVLLQQAVLSAQLRQVLGPPASRRGRFRPMLARLKPLMAYGLGGALLMQIDKPLVGSLFSVEAAGRWFLAMTYALTPVALLAGPLHQYFSPRLAAALNSPSDVIRIGRQFQVATVVAAAAPSAVLAWHAPLIISIWLPHAADATMIAGLAQSMVAAVAVGAMGYLPTAYLIASGDRAWLARLAWGLLGLVIAGLLVMSLRDGMAGLALVYSIYHVAGCLLLWRRMLRSWPARGQRWALIGEAWLYPLVGTALPTLAVLAALDHLSVDPWLATLAASSAGGLAMAAVAICWWLRYPRRPLLADIPICRNAADDAPS